MVVIPVFNLNIKSYKGEYSVSFIDVIPMPIDDIIVIDSNVYDIFYKDKELNSSKLFIVDANEHNKTLDQSKKLLDFLIDNEFNKSKKIVAIGGGIIQDIVSFTSSILFRGIDWKFYPTTLLAQCDSCIGSKTSINYKKYKNLLGGFHPPKKILIWNGFLKTLEDKDIKSGIGEMLHYFLLNHKLDISEKLVNDEDVVGNINQYIHESLSIKKKIIEKDEFDKGERNLFNYGHTFGHAIETLSGYEINHGQAVTMGMIIANRISLRNNMISKEFHDKLFDILNKNKPDYRINSIDEYISCLKKDKKNVNDELTCILLNEEYGERTQINYDEIKEIYLKHLSNY